ncbi:hypothetical protein [Chryseobacterium arthrosphaerae]|uniref:hypothetical protein n=1 Tax=Chryseobacterium arthrosphaerae TaxID=651561 RepID=UPI00241E9C41|nr:hypothetical protein [Chryseobacterium arthrosphaerae]
MENRIVKVILEDNRSIEYKEKSIDFFRRNGSSENLAKSQFHNQHKKWEKDLISYFSISIEEFAKDEYDLIDSDKKKDIDDFDDDDILSEAEYRGIIPVGTELQNGNILNEDFVERFVTIVNRGNTTEIENALSYLEFKFKI